MSLPVARRVMRPLSPGVLQFERSREFAFGGRCFAAIVAHECVGFSRTLLLPDHTDLLLDPLEYVIVSLQ